MICRLAYQFCIMCDDQYSPARSSFSKAHPDTEIVLNGADEEQTIEALRNASSELGILL